MTTDLWMLVATALLALVLPYVYATGRVMRPGGLRWSMGNREQPFEAPAWAARAYRAHQNLVENIGPFAALVLVAHVSGKAGSTSAVGATLFFWARVAHALVYTLGIKHLRTAAFTVGLFGEAAILLSICR